MLMFRSVSKRSFFENRLNDGGVNFMNALNNITKKICICSKTDSFTFLITAEKGMHVIYFTIIYVKVLYKSNYKIVHTFFLAFRKQKSFKFDLLGPIPTLLLFKFLIKRCLIGILWHSIRRSSGT